MNPLPRRCRMRRGRAVRFLSFTSRYDAVTKGRDSLSLCPYCGQQGMFESAVVWRAERKEFTTPGLRLCPTNRSAGCGANERILPCDTRFSASLLSS
jgi:hypothetical protein